MTLPDKYGIVILEKRILHANPIEKGKPFERVGRKALEPKSAKVLWRIWLSAAKKDLKFLDAHSSMEE